MGYRRATAILLMLLAVAGVAAPGTAQTSRIPETREEIALSFAPLVKAVAPAVVNIYTKRVVEARPRSPLFDDPRG